MMFTLYKKVHWNLVKFWTLNYEVDIGSHHDMASWNKPFPITALSWIVGILIRCSISVWRWNILGLWSWEWTLTNITHVIPIAEHQVHNWQPQQVMVLTSINIYIFLRLSWCKNHLLFVYKIVIDSLSNKVFVHSRYLLHAYN